jgi:hypothetical protein
MSLYCDGDAMPLGEKLSSAETAVSVRLADADESKPGRLSAAASHRTKAMSRGMT